MMQDIRRDETSNNLDPMAILNQIVVNAPGGVIPKFRIFQDSAGIVYLSYNVDPKNAFALDNASASASIMELSALGITSFFMPAGSASWAAGAAEVSAGSIVSNSMPTTGQTVAANTNGDDETLYITPAGTLLALTVALPLAANSRIGQIERGFITQIITTLTVNVAGSGTIIGASPTTSAVNSSFAYQCVSTAANGTWIRLY